MTGEEYLKKWRDAMQRWLDRNPLRAQASETPVAGGPMYEEQAETLRRMAREARWRAWLGG